MIKCTLHKDWRLLSGQKSFFPGAKEDSVPVTLPHDAAILRPRDPHSAGQSGNGFFREENYTYVRNLYLDEESAGQEVWLEFEGIYQDAFIYINHAFAGKCPYGYGNYYIRATGFVRAAADNEIKVVVKNGVPSGRWYTGGGIYRNVNLLVGGREHFIPDGLHLTTVDADASLAVVEASAVIAHTGTGRRNARYKVQLFDGNGALAAENEMEFTLCEQTKDTYTLRLYVHEPMLWDAEHPALYAYHAILLEQDQILDEERGSFGIRTLSLDPANGLRINGKSVKLRGGCIHHDNGILGAVTFPHAEEERIRKLKDAGYNAVRSAHYPMSRTLLDACDRHGMYVLDEFSDVWTTAKVDFDYSERLSDCWQTDLVNMANKDYNHPCVLMYSIGNEIPEAGNPMDVLCGKKFADLLHRLDPSRYTTNCLNIMMCMQDKLGEILSGLSAQDEAPGKEGRAPGEINEMMTDFAALTNRVIATEEAGELIRAACGQVDIAGYNYAACRYEKDIRRYPNRVLVGSETNPQNLDENWPLVLAYPQVIGDFSWTAWDYLGEAGIGRVIYGDNAGMEFYAPYPYKAAYCGDFNLIGDRRPVSYWRQIIWGLRNEPYIAVRPPKHHGEKRKLPNWGLTDAAASWNYAGYEGKPVTVEVYSDAEEVALFLNGELLEKKAVGEQKRAIAVFETVYVPGTLEAVAYRGGAKTGRSCLVTAGQAKKLCAVCDSDTIPRDGSDICYVDISVTDCDGHLNPEAEPAVSLGIEGPGVILGFGSASPDSEENYYDTTAKPFEGRLRAAIRGTGERGTIRLRATAAGLAAADLSIPAV